MKSTSVRPLPIRSQFYKVLAGSLIGFIFISLSGAYFVFWPLFEQQDRQNALTNTARVVNQLDNAVNDLHQFTTDWSIWDDTYAFVQTGDTNFVDSNLPLNTFTLNDLSDVLFLDANNQEIWSGSLSADGHTVIPIAAQLRTFTIAHMPATIDGISGFLAIDERLFIYSLRGVTNSQGDISPNGAIVMARELDQPYRDNLRRQLAIEFSLGIVAEPEINNGRPLADQALKQAFSVDQQTEQNYVKYLQPMLNFEQALLVTVWTPRGVSQEARKLLLWNGALVSVAALALLWFVGAILNKRVVQPLSHISLAVENWQDNAQGQLSLARNESLEIARISEAIEGMHQEIMQLASFDQLTGLANRRMLEERLALAVERANRGNSSFALICIDLDNFKPINDDYGHHLGDLVLQIVAARLMSTARAVDTISRTGGDEFVALIELSQDKETEAARVCRRFIEVIEQPMNLEGVECTLSASLGAALYPQDSTATETLMTQADQAMYQAKTAGRARYCLWQAPTAATG